MAMIAGHVSKAAVVLGQVFTHCLPFACARSTTVMKESKGLFLLEAD
jgi:hypothetical protein